MQTSNVVSCLSGGGEYSIWSSDLMKATLPASAMNWVKGFSDVLVILFPPGTWYSQQLQEETSSHDSSVFWGTLGNMDPPLRKEGSQFSYLSIHGENMVEFPDQPFTCAPLTHFPGWAVAEKFPKHPFVRSVTFEQLRENIWERIPLSPFFAWFFQVCYWSVISI